MDVSKLDKMKVVDLRNELQSRGLDTKGVKAVLVERLRAVMESGGENAAPGTPIGTPAKRSRRTRSMTRSPSPSPKKVVEPELEALPEEENETAEEPAETAEAEDEVMEEAPVEEDEQAADEEIPENNQDAEEEEEQETEEVVEERESVEQNETQHKADLENEEDKSFEKPTEEADEEMKESKNEEAEVQEKRSDETDADEKKSRRKRSHSASSNHSQHSKERRLSKTKEENLEDEPTMEDKQFGLSWFDSDLYLRIDPVTFTSAKPMSHEIYSLVWGGVRANYGVRDGKVCYEVRLAEETNMSRSHQFRDEPFVRGFRVGFSLPNTKLLLGEDENSFAYCESGRKALNSEFREYGKAYQLDDVIGCYLDLESSPCTIKYTLNGEDLGVAFDFDKSILGEDGALFPHILTKGYEFHVNFADNDNLLVNVERPKRMRRKHKEPKKVLTDDNNEKWEVVDETKPDEPEKNEKDEEMKEDEKEEATEKSTADDEVKKEEQSEQENEQDDKEKDAEAEKEKDASQQDGASEPAANGDVKHDESDEKNLENADTNAKESDKKTEENSSRTKRRRTDSSSKHDQNSEDEYEEVIPEPRDPVSLLPGYELIALIPEESYIPGPQRPESRKECEVVLLVGLPGAGKTHWTLNRLQEQPEKRYHVIGADALISKMTIDGEPRKGHHKGRWEKVYELCLNSLSSLEDIAMKRRRNFILDQTNAYASAQRRKMKGFADFKRIAVVCIPNADELKRRNDEKTEKGTAQNIRESTLTYLRANFTLPSMEFGWFDDIIYTDLSGDEAKEEVKKYIEKGKKALDANRDKRNRNHRRYDDRGTNDRYRGNSGWQDNRNDRRRYDDRGGGYRGNQGWRDNRSGGGYDNRRYDGGGGYRNNSGGYRDNRNNRYGGGGGGGGGSSNWIHNNRNNRYDDRYGSGGGGGGSRHRDNYGGGGNYRSSGSSSSRNQRDFRPGHHDNRSEDSRGGYDSAAGAASARYEPYSSSGSSKHTNNGSSKGGKWNSYSAQQSQEQHPQQWQQQWQQYQQQQIAPQQQEWGYGAADMQAYSNQWQNDPNQQQWMSWYQQQGNVQTGDEANHYWSQYSYPTSSNSAAGGAEAKK